MRPLSREARLYGLKELARRAGVSPKFFSTWKIAIEESRTRVWLDPCSSTMICFEHALEDAYPRVAAGEISVRRASWLRPPLGAYGSEDLVIPFSAQNGADLQPLFTRGSGGSFCCREDILLSLVFTLCRVEEAISGERDAHGRFPASASLAARFGFLERPFVDEYGLAFEQVISELVPAWKSKRAPLRANLTHDIDGVGIPPAPLTSVGHTLRRHRPFATLRDMAAACTSMEPSELVLVRELARISVSRHLRSTFFWKASPQTLMDDGYDPLHPKVQCVIRDLREAGFELGVHPGYFTFGSRSDLSREVQRLREVLGANPLGGRQHYLRWSAGTWLDWEACGLIYDSTVGYADRFGFRAGTAIPYRPWCLEENRELRLIEVPLILMDCTPVKYMCMRKEAAMLRIRACIRRTAAVGGVFTILWHNLSLLDPHYRGWYEPILDMLSSADSFRIPSDPETLW